MKVLMRFCLLFFFVSHLGLAQEEEIETPLEIEEIDIPEITVLGRSSRKKSVSDYVPTVSELSGLRLEKKKQTTLGETISREAGVNSSFFGPNASRPVIRGLEGERVRVLQDGIGVLDASGTSPDHAVSSDPLLTKRVEVVRGSAALLYGSSAIGGVVNVINGRIPDSRLDRPSLLLSSRGSTTDWGRSGGIVGEASLGRFSFHADASLRGADNYHIPGFARSESLRTLEPLPSGEEENKKIVKNSENKTFDAALGVSYVGDSSHFGASFSRFGTTYGTVVEPDVTIDLDRYRVDLEGEVKSDGFIQSARFKGAGSYYTHNEREDTEIATTFINRGAEARADLKHAPIAGLVEGIFGVQGRYSLLSAVGEEAFLPTTTSTSYALFMYEEMALGHFNPTFGARVDRAGVSSESSDEFGTGEFFGFWTPSVSMGLLYKLSDQFTVGLNTAFTRRAPNYQELFADGPHVAVGVFEVGDHTLLSEIGRSVELSLRHEHKSGRGRVSVFTQNFNRFISLSPIGSNDVDSGFPIYSYQSVDAMLFGAELEYHQQLPWRVWRGVFEVGLVLDWVRGINGTDSTNLPRMPPVRENISLSYRSSAFSIDLEMQRSEAQGIVAVNELPTGSYTIFNLGVEVPITTSFGQFDVLLSFNNMFNAEARNHVSFAKNVAPMSGRNLVLGLQARI